MLSWKLRTSVLAALALAVAFLAAPTGALASGGEAPTKFFKKNLRLGVYLYDSQDLVFDATLNEVAPSVRPAVEEYLWEQLGSASFEIDATAAKCTLITDGNGARVPCSDIADMVDEAYDGVYAWILARPVAGDELSFRAKKMTVWVETAPADPEPEPELLPEPPRFFEKNLRLGVYLHDSHDLTFDATLNDIPESVRPSVAEYLWQELGGATFDLDATDARCFIVTEEGGARVPCSDIADMVDESYDGFYASILAKPVAGDGLSFQAKKIVVWL